MNVINILNILNTVEIETILSYATNIGFVWDNSDDSDDLNVIVINASVRFN